jgi:hypothetical protein
MTTFKQVIIYIALGIFLAGLSGLVIYQNKQNNNLQTLLMARNSELQEAKLEIGRGQTTIGDANTMIGKLNSQIKDEIKKRNAILTLYAELEGRYQVEQKKVKIVTQILYKDREIPIPVGKIFVKNENGTYSEVTSMKFNYNDFRISVEADAVKQEFSYKLHQKFRGLFVESKAPGGLVNHYAEIYEMDGDKDVGKVELTNFKVIKSEELPAKMHWWAPHLDISLGYGLSGTLDHGFIGDIGLSFSGYGKTKDDLNWRFFRIAGGILRGNRATVTFSPVQYNLGKNIPFLSNLWIIPSIGGDATEHTWMTSLTLGVVF